MPFSPSSLLPAALCALGVWLAAFPLRRLLMSLGVLDLPGSRSSHLAPTPRGGGLAVLAGFLAAGIWLPGFFGLLGGFMLVGLGLVAAISLADDVRSRPFLIRLAIHLLGALLVLLAWPKGGLIPLWGLALGGLWIVGMANVTNFIDGLNGLATLQIVLSGVFGAVFCGLAGLGDSPLAGAFLLLAAAALGFVPHNFPRARLFLGDVGSVSLGFTLAVLALHLWDQAGWRTAVALAALQSNAILDTGITLLRRIRRGAPWHEAHKENFFQRLHQSGWSHARVTLLETALLTLCGGLLALVLKAPLPLYLAGLAVVGLVWAGFLAFCEAAHRRAAVRG